ncbi:hypothetical protein IFM89_029108 [Coptis chinensis]|uniref:Uncharacterized protein n=1 Tax=Coptis chinensis TaxID=261450 RepID=A0A835LC08_9MAGN|nr:hypothetical protein IFM89_029108 [Coptis chinensis]
MSQVLVVKVILLIFEAVTGLKMNMAKTSLFAVSEIDNFEDLARVMGCEVMKLSCRNLELPLEATYKSKTVWDLVIEMVQQRSITLATPPRNLPDFKMLLLFGCGSVLLGGAECTWNNLLNRKIDSKVQGVRDCFCHLLFCGCWLLSLPFLSRNIFFLVEGSDALCEKKCFGGGLQKTYMIETTLRIRYGNADLQQPLHYNPKSLEYEGPP